MAASFAFDRFVLDIDDRRLCAGDEPIELNARYFDALTLLVRENGRLIPKDRFMAEVWRGIPVTDEALTQCIKTLRRLLGDQAGRPSFIETVPKHGYRFIAPVTTVGSAAGLPAQRSNGDWRRFIAVGAAGTAGGGIAGAIGGLIYGFAATAQPVVGAISVLLVLLSVTTLVALIGGAGVGFAIATSELAKTRNWSWFVIAGAGGGLLTGAVAKMLGVDAFVLLLGHSPGPITGAMEGMILGAATGSGAWLSTRSASLRRSASVAGLLGTMAGVAIGALGGRLMLGSLDLLAHDFPGSRLRVDQVSLAFGEADFGPVTRIVTAGLEGGLFAACVVGAMVAARRAISRA